MVKFHKKREFMRLDEYLFEKGYVTSRNKAKELIKEKKVKVNGKTVTKPSLKVDNPDIEIMQKVYVSRAAWKLKNYLDKYNISFENKSIIDVGSSTGGFSEVALEKGAKKVVCVDVGNNQLHSKIRQNPKVEVYENTDIRDFEYESKFDILVSDVSFISLLKIFDKLSFLSDEMILLFKPQFEVGKDVKRDKRGVVIDKEAIDKARENFENYISKKFEILRSEESSVKGKEGNIEYIYHLRRKVD